MTGSSLGLDPRENNCDDSFRQVSWGAADVRERHMTGGGGKCPTFFMACLPVQSRSSDGGIDDVMDWPVTAS